MKQNFKMFFKVQRSCDYKLLFSLVLLFFWQNSFAARKYVELSRNDKIEEKKSIYKQKTKKDFVQISNFSKAKIKKSESHKENQEKIKKEASYSFRPLLIQGKKRLIQKAKDMKVDSGNIAESKLFFVDIDFKDRIFEHEGKR